MSIKKVHFPRFSLSSRSNASKLVTFDLGSKTTSVLCQMGDFGCGDGGWTPVMKIHGTKVCVYY